MDTNTLPRENIKPVRASREKVEIHNLNNNEYEEFWNEELIKIPAKSFVVMKRRKAVRFLGSVPPNDKNGQMVDKMLQLRKIGGTSISEPNESSYLYEYVCHLDGKVFESKKELDAHLKKYESQVVKPIENIKCPLCNKSFKNTDILLAHLVIHKENNNSEKDTRKAVKKGKNNADTSTTV